MDVPTKQPEPSVQAPSFDLGLPSVPTGLPPALGWPSEDGTLLTEQPTAYGQEWTEAMFAIDDVLQADPDYQFLQMVAGATNTDVESLYEPQSIGAVVQEANTVASETLRAQRVLQDMWQDYQELGLFVKDFHRQANGRDTYRHMRQHVRRALAAAHTYRTRMLASLFRVYLGRATLQGELPQVLEPEDDDDEGNDDDKRVTRDEFAEAARDVALSFRWLANVRAREMGINGTPQLTQMQPFPRSLTSLPNELGTLLRRLINTVTQPRQGEDDDDDGQGESDVQEMFFQRYLLVVIYLSWQRVMFVPQLTGYLRADDDDNTAIVGAPPQGSLENRLPMRVWRAWTTALLQEWSSVEPGPAQDAEIRQRLLLRPEFSLLHSLATRPTTAQQQEVNVRSTGLARQTFGQAVRQALETSGRFLEWVQGQQRRVEAQWQRSVGMVDDLGGDDDDDEEASIDDLPSVMSQPSIDTEQEGSLESQGQQLMLRNLERVSDTMHVVRQNLQSLVQRGQMSSQTSSTRGSKRGGGSGKSKGKGKSKAMGSSSTQPLLDPFDMFFNRFDRELQDNLRDVGQRLQQIGQRYLTTQQEIDRTMRRSVDPLMSFPERDQQRPSAEWALHPRFTGRISLTAPVIAGINNAFAEVTRRLPGLSPSSVPTEERLRAFKHTPILSQLFANLVATHILMASIEFPTQYHLDSAHSRAVAARTTALLNISSWVWGSGGTPYDTHQRNMAAVPPERIPLLPIEFPSYSATMTTAASQPPEPLWIVEPDDGQDRDIWETSDPQRLPGRTFRVGDTPIYIRPATSGARPKKRQKTTQPSLDQRVSTMLQWSRADVRQAVLQRIVRPAHQHAR